MTPEEHYAQFTEKELRQMWQTPQRLYDSLEAEFGLFDLDACADQFNHKAPIYWSGDDEFDARLYFLWEEAANYRVFCNPPSSIIRDVLEAYWHPFAKARPLAVFVLPCAGVNSQWFHRYALRGEVRVPTSRIQYEPPPGLEVQNPKANRSDSLIVIFDGVRRVVPEVYPCDPLTGKRLFLKARAG